MNKTVVAIFNSMDEAQTAADDLFDNGFLKENIDVSSGAKYEEDEQGESGITRFFKNLFGTQDEKSQRYSTVAKEGFLVAVHTHSEQEALEACEILDDNGAIDVNDRYTRYATPTADNNYVAEDIDDDVDTDLVDTNDDEFDDDNDQDETTTIPVIEEEMKVDKKEVPTGKVRVRSRIVEKPVEENLRLREEHIHVERKKVDREPTDEELRNFKNATDSQHDDES